MPCLASGGGSSWELLPCEAGGILDRHVHHGATLRVPDIGDSRTILLWSVDTSTSAVCGRPTFSAVRKQWSTLDCHAAMHAMDMALRAVTARYMAHPLYVGHTPAEATDTTHSGPRVNMAMYFAESQTTDVGSAERSALLWDDQPVLP